ncbi:unnamed protein product [Ilex paraguariensis]|uniref:Uncharacterized protein n=1 Tax=Ilex paraguariensis TaxID=185542 RepID=A0ABC8USZ2_9AQUA
MPFLRRKQITETAFIRHIPRVASPKVITPAGRITGYKQTNAFSTKKADNGNSLYQVPC